MNRIKIILALGSFIRGMFSNGGIIWDLFESHNLLTCHIWMSFKCFVSQIIKVLVHRLINQRSIASWFLSVPPSFRVHRRCFLRTLYIQFVRLLMTIILLRIITLLWSPINNYFNGFLLNVIFIHVQILYRDRLFITPIGAFNPTIIKSLHLYFELLL